MHETGGRLKSISRVQHFPACRVAACRKAAGQKDGQSIGCVHKPLLHDTGGVHQACHIPVGVLQTIEPLIQRVVVVGVPVSEDQVIDVPQTPHECKRPVNRIL